jgi:putative membrane protein
MTSEERPFHIAAVGVEALAQLRQLLLPIVVVAVVGGRDAPGMALLFGAAGAAATVVVAYVRWTTARWWVSDDAVHLRQGVLTRTESSVALARVQAVDTVRGPVQRLFGVVALHVQAAGGGRDGEVVLQAVTYADAELLRAAVRAGGAEPAAAAAQGAPAGPTWSLGRGRLLVAALTSGSLGVLVPIIAAGSQFGDEVLGNERAERLVPSTPAEAAMLVAAVLAFAWALSIAGALVAFSGFAVRREDDRLLIRRGIVERRDQSVPAARVHAVTVVEGLLREPFGLASVRLETAGYGSEAATTRTLVPLARRDEVPGILAELVPELAGEAGALAPPPRGRCGATSCRRSPPASRPQPRSSCGSARPACPPSSSRSPAPPSASVGSARPAGVSPTGGSCCARAGWRAARSSPTRAGSSG